MNLIARGLFVVGGIAVGSFAINHFVFGNTGDASIRSSRIGEWRKAEVREACFPTTERPAAHVKAGRLKRSDFGFFVAEQMQSLLDQYAGAADSCPPASTA